MIIAQTCDVCFQGRRYRSEIAMVILNGFRDHLEEMAPVTYSVDIGDGRMVKRHIHQLLQNVNQSPRSTSNAIDDYCYYLPVQEVDLVPLTPPPRPLEEEQCYSRRQHRPPARFIHESYQKGEELH